jgi:hypothetical protein
LKTRGRRHSPGENLLMAHVAQEFSKKKRKLGAKQAARELNVSLASFYNYAGGKDLPRMEVLRDAQQKWGIKWPLIDPSEILRTRKVRSVEQYAFAFLEAVRAEDVEVVKVGPPREGILQVTLKIHFLPSGDPSKGRVPSFVRKSR